MKNKSTIILTIISTLFFIVGIGGYLGLFFMVENQKSVFIEKSVAQAETKLHQESLTALVRTLSDTEEDRESLQTRVLREEDVVDFLALVETLGKELSVTLTTNSLTVEPLNATFEALVMNVNVEGRYESIIHILKLMEQIPYQSSLGKVQLENANDSFWKGAFEMRVTKLKKI